MPVFGNPLGLLALAGVPAVLAIHFFQRRGREVPAATLFLLERARREAAGGRTFERLSNSLPMWLQLAAVVVLAWVLSEPRYPKAGSVQRVAVVVDSSASMAAFRDSAVAEVRRMLPVLAAGASRVELTLIESAPERPRLYRGGSMDGLAAALGDWQPWSGPLDPAPALRLGRSLVSADGAVLYLTDTPAVEAPPFGALRLAVGEPVENVGFTGVTFEEADGGRVWKAMLRNHGRVPAERRWWVETEAGRTEERSIQLAAGALAVVQGKFPEGGRLVRLVIPPDRFPLDDTLPMIWPQPKRLAVHDASPQELRPLAGRLIEALDGGVAAAPDAADLTLAGGVGPPVGHAIVLGGAAVPLSGRWLAGGMTAANHPLMEGLQWQSLMVREGPATNPSEGEIVLLRQEQRPLIVLRSLGTARQLVFHFDPAQSNLEQLPAFVLLVHRFAESLRRSKVAQEAVNLETGQAIELAAAPGVPWSVTATDPEGRAMPADLVGDGRRAIPRPGFMAVRQGDAGLLDAAVRFGDPREADLQGCGREQPGSVRTVAGIERHTRADPLRRLWILTVAALLLVSWIPFNRGQTRLS